MYLSPEDYQILKSETVLAEQNGILTKKQMDVIYRNHLFNMFVPEEFGGLGFDLVKGLLLEEELAHIDGSLGWTVTLCAGANMFVGYIDGFLAKMIFQSPRVCFGGSSEIKGIAREVKEGYIINGEWDYIVGLPHCTILTANCQIERKGELLYDATGAPVYKSFFFFPKEVEIIDDWKSIGLVASASHSFRIKQLKIEENRSFAIQSENRVIDTSIYKYPYKEFTLFTLAANHLGMQSHFMEELDAHFASDPSNEMYKHLKSILEEHKVRYIARKKVFYDLAEKSLEAISANGVLTLEMQLEIEKLCKEIVHIGRNAMLRFLPSFGMEVMHYNHRINRIVRDVLTASQFHVLMPSKIDE